MLIAEHFDESAAGTVGRFGGKIDGTAHARRAANDQHAPEGALMGVSRAVKQGSQIALGDLPCLRGGEDFGRDTDIADVQLTDVVGGRVKQKTDLGTGLGGGHGRADGASENLTRIGMDARGNVNGKDGQLTLLDRVDPGGVLALGGTGKTDAKQCVHDDTILAWQGGKLIARFSATALPQGILTGALNTHLACIGIMALVPIAAIANDGLIALHPQKASQGKAVAAVVATTAQHDDAPSGSISQEQKLLRLF